MKVPFTLVITFFISLNGISQTVQDFSLINIADGKSISLSSFQSCTGVAIIFTSNECPFDIKYRKRIKELNEQFKGSIQFILINSHNDPAENENKMKEKYAEWSISIPYLSDKEQVAMECLGAKKSPESFLLKRNKSEYTIVYSGSIDDNALVNTDVNNSYLSKAINQLLKGERISVSSNRAAGCTIRKN